MNPARSFGPALVAAEWNDFWTYSRPNRRRDRGRALAYQGARRRSELAQEGG